MFELINLLNFQQGNIFEYLEYLMNGIKKIGGDDIEMPKRSRQGLELFCMFFEERKIDSDLSTSWL